MGNNDTAYLEAVAQRKELQSIVVDLFRDGKDIHWRKGN